MKLEAFKKAHSKFMYQILKVKNVFCTIRDLQLIKMFIATRNKYKLRAL